MPRPQHVAIALVAAALLAGPARTARAESVPPAGTPPPKAKAPAAAPAGKAAPARFSVSHGLCKDFLTLASDLRGMVVAWTAGRYHKLDRWIFDEPTARKVVVGVEQECDKNPEALFRYKVVGEIDKLK